MEPKDVPQFDLDDSFMMDLDDIIAETKARGMPPRSEEQENNDFWFNECQIDDDIDYNDADL